jgi:4-aminobutyrate aminotransferase-like enzyme
MIALEFAPGVARAVQDAVHAGLVARGFLCGYKPAASLLRLYPPLVIGRDELERFVTALDETLTACGSR